MVKYEVYVKVSYKILLSSILNSIVVYNGELRFKFLTSNVNPHPDKYRKSWKSSSNGMTPLDAEYYDEPDYFVRMVQV